MKSFVQTSWQSAKKSIADTDKIRKKNQSISLPKTPSNHKRKLERKRGTKDLQNRWKIMNKIAVVNSYLLIITLNIRWIKLTNPKT